MRLVPSASSVVAVVAAVAAAAGAATAASAAAWERAADLREGLAGAEKALVLGEAEAAGSLEPAQTAARALAGELEEVAPAEAGRLVAASTAAARAVAQGDAVGLAVARSEAWTALLAGAAAATLEALERGDPQAARAWLLVREFRPPTRLSRPGADATVALAALAEGRSTTARARAAVRADLLDTYQARLRNALETVVEAGRAGFPARRAQAAGLVRGYVAILGDAFREQRGQAAYAELASAAEALVAGAAAQRATDVDRALAELTRLLEGFRAAPLSAEEERRRAGQLQRFVALVPIEYARGVEDGRVTLDFEIQEAITFRDGAYAAFGDLESVLAARHRERARALGQELALLGEELAAAAGGERVAPEDEVRARSEQVLGLAAELFPAEWEDAGGEADFDVIAATLDRLEGAVAAGEYARAEAARLEAYAFFEFGPEQRLRGLAPDLFVRVEGLFWYGDGDDAGLAQLVKRKASASAVGETRTALDAALADAEAAIGAGPRSTTAVVGNTAVIVFREGLEAVLILAALMASMVGAQRHLRRPMLAGAAGALVATAITWVIARTIVSSLNRYGEKLEAVVSLVAIAVLLLILNWFFHRVYWTGHLAGLHRRKTGVLRGAGATLVGAQLLGLAALGFTSVYREGFETVLFLQALVIDAGTLPVLAGVGVGMVGTVAAGLVAVVLQRRLPYKRMLIVTGLMVAWVLVAMVGTTVQVLQKVGWLPVTPLGDFHFPSWVGLWSGVYPTWEGIAAQVGALALVVGSYLVLEAVRGRRRARLLAQPRAASAPAQPARPVSPREPGAAPAEPVGPHGASRPRVVV